MSVSIEHEPVVPMEGWDAWRQNQQVVAAKPLAFCEDFPRLAQRHEAWWRQAVEGPPLLLATANKDPQRPITRRLELLERPEEWLAAKQADLTQTHRVGDALPAIRVDFGPVIIGGMLGGTLAFGADTSWTHPFIEDGWRNAPEWRLPDDNRWWVLMQELAEMLGADAEGRYLMCTPDLGGSADVLLNLRGATGLCMDAIQQPETLIASINAIYPIWRETFSMFYGKAAAHGVGLVHWLMLWSNQPYMVPACDFNFMIGPETFNEVCLPDIARQTATVGRGAFHLDGPGAVKHLDALLETPHIEAIQFVPGAQDPSVLPWLDMLEKIQAAGKSVDIDCPFAEVLEVAEALDSRSLAITTVAPSVEALDAMYAAFTRRFGQG